MASNNVITNIDSKTKAAKHLNLSGLFFIIAYLLVAYMLRDLVSGIMFIPYMIFSGICSFYLILPSRFNRGRTNLESLFVLFHTDNRVYRPFNGGGGHG